ncbi:DUF547 domain-containing protein [Methylomarinum sp. Ch1-1]|uniref:DUF547 domain-containing protein n=1 Tax=Methylomarinum roseum TaxID=3067653 RepID=A0AAU7NR07_9GAMM|nr:DUF547 domain-containing protein [Methylomarinum sp. Ch1-1]MDP4520636.1 DUF547 domain-containing protein [Methylomarinum sp. Ch1-1]
MSLRALFFIIVVALAIQPVAAEEPDWNDYRSVLKHVKPGLKNGVKLMQVDYAALNSDGSLEKAYRNLSAFDINHLASKEERLAFYINAYNILALKMVADHWPTDSIKDAGSFFSPVWNKPAGQLGGKTVTLGEVEHEILRKMGEPRIHMAIVCASVSCPDLRAEPYTAVRLNEQLDEQTRQFLDNSGKGLRIAGKVIQVSKIFDWFEEDFEAYGGVASFIKRYRPGLPDLRIKTNIPYDWSVNGS